MAKRQPRWLRTFQRPPQPRPKLRHDAYVNITPWRSADVWMAEGSALHDLHYQALYLETGEAVSKSLWVRWLAAVSSFADRATGRNVRAAEATIAARAGCSVRSVRRCQRLARLLGIWRVVFAGRELRADERSYFERQGIYLAGWPNVAALTASAEYSTGPIGNVDNSVDNSVGIYAGHLPAQAGYYLNLTSRGIQFRTRAGARSARAKRDRRKDLPAEVIGVARECREDRRVPGWIRVLSVAGLARLLLRYPRIHSSYDLTAVLTRWLRAGRTFPERIERPYAYLEFLLENCEKVFFA